MAPPVRPASLLLIVGVILAGCVDPGQPASTSPADSSPPLTPAQVVLPVLESIPVPDFDRAAAVGRWESFLTTYPKRDYLLPHNTLASEFLRSELQTAGFDTEILTYPFTSAVPLLPAEVRVIRGTLAPPSNSTHRLALVAHYDTITTTAQGAYDDGAGTMVQLEICKLLAAQKDRLQHGIDCLFFDAEEEGLVASRKYTDWYNQTPDRGFTYDLVFGYDMTGLNWPGHSWDLYAMIGTQHDALQELTEPFHGFLELVLHAFYENNVTAGAKEGIDILDVHDRNSDEQSFKRYGIPVVRFAGGRNAADYPMYHQPADVVPYVYDFAGGRPNFELGFEAAVLASYYTILGFDAFDPWNLPTA